MSDPYFGFRLRAPTASDTLSVNIDSLSIVPEPSSLLLMALGLLALAGYTRRSVI